MPLQRLSPPLAVFLSASCFPQSANYPLGKVSQEHQLGRALHKRNKECSTRNRVSARATLSAGIHLSPNSPLSVDNSLPLDDILAVHKQPIENSRSGKGSPGEDLLPGQPNSALLTAPSLHLTFVSLFPSSVSYPAPESQRLSRPGPICSTKDFRCTDSVLRHRYFRR